jgi:hypothetical protein
MGWKGLFTSHTKGEPGSGISVAMGNSVGDAASFGWGGSWVGIDSGEQLQRRAARTPA